MATLKKVVMATVVTYGLILGARGIMHMQALDQADRLHQQYLINVGQRKELYRIMKHEDANGELPSGLHRDAHDELMAWTSAELKPIRRPFGPVETLDEY